MHVMRLKQTEHEEFSAYLDLILFTRSAFFVFLKVSVDN